MKSTAGAKVLALWVWLCSALATADAGGRKAPSVRYTLGSAKIPVRAFPFISNDKLIAEDEERAYNATSPAPIRVGVPIEDSGLAGLNLVENGVWTELPDGEGKVLRYAFESKGANSIEIYLEDARFPSPMELFIYSDKYTQHVIAEDLGDTGIDWSLTSHPIPGHRVTVELFVPQDLKFDKDSVSLIMSGAVHNYKEFWHLFDEEEKGLCGSQDCNVDINCPEGDDWQTEKRSVFKLSMSGTICSGSMISDPTGTRHLALTATHCLKNVNEGDTKSNWSGIFKLERSTCGVGCPSTGISKSGIQILSMCADVALIRFTTSSFSNSYDLYYNGFDASGSDPGPSCGIHHPDGDYKKISCNNLDWKVYSGNFYEWIVSGWDFGTTEGGSSGSPLFEKSTRQVIGVDSAVDSCTYNNPCNSNCNTKNWYGKLSACWNCCLKEIIFGTSNTNQNKFNGSNLPFGAPEDSVAPSPPPPPPPCAGDSSTTADCDGQCFNSAVTLSIYSNGVCNDGKDGGPNMACEALFWDGDDCEPPLVCETGYVKDCDEKQCISSSNSLLWISDDICDDGVSNAVHGNVNLNCANFFNDGDACEELNPGLPCTEGKVQDCGSLCIDADLLILMSGNGICNDGVSNGAFNLNCEALNNDEGDCAFNTCEDGQAEDCNGACFPASTFQEKLGNGVCDDGSLGISLTCEEYANDAGDCTSGNAPLPSDADFVFDLSNTGSSISVFASFIVDLGGFQMKVVGPPLLSVGGGAAELAEFTISENAGTVIAFSLAGNIIPAADNAKLVTMNFPPVQDDLDIPVCLEDIIISDSNGISVEVGYLNSPEQPCAFLSKPCAGEEVALGDGNQDGITNILDVVFLINIAISEDEAEPCSFSVLDLNSSGTLDILDIIALINLVIGPSTIDPPSP